MADAQIALCSLQLKEFHGEIVEKVCVYLIKKGETPLRVLAKETSLTVQQTKKALAVLIQQNIVFFSVNTKRGYVQYGVINVKQILLRIRFPRFIYSAKTLFGDAAELIIEELLQAGQMEMSKVITKTTTRINDAYQLQGQQGVSSNEVKDKFAKLAQTHFIQRCPQVEKDPVLKELVPCLTITETQMYALPDINEVSTRKRKASDDNTEMPSKKRKTDDEEPCLDSGIYWHVNFDRFHQYLRDQAMINAIANKIDKRAAEIVRTILRISERKTAETSPVTTPVSCNEIFDEIPKEVNLDRHTLAEYLTILCEDASDFVNKVGDSGGGMYSVYLKSAITSLCRGHVESVIQERFGSKSLRIFRLLLLKKNLEQKQIEDFAMIPAKETKELTYRMFGESLISLTEVPKTPDHAPSRTFYLFSVNLNQVARKLLEKSYKAMANLLRRRNCEMKENRRLLDKQQRVEAIVAQLEQSDVDPAQKEEIEQMITPLERAQINKVKHMTEKLQQSELQLDDTIFIFQTYLHYCQMS